MVKPGQYAEYPLPEPWLPTLALLRPCQTRPSARPLPSLGALVDALLHQLDERPRLMLWGRLGAEQTLQELGDLHGVTRERVRQIERKAQQTLLRGAEVRQILGGVGAAFERAGTLLLDVGAASSGLVPQATPDQLWQFVCAVWEFSAPRGFQTTRIGPGLWLYTTSELPSAARIAAALGGPDQPARFLSAAPLAELLELEETELLTLWMACSRLSFTAGGLFGSAGWTLPQWVEAVAERLAAAGFHEWHFSEMARALEHAAPQQFPALTGRNVAAVLSLLGGGVFGVMGRVYPERYPEEDWMLKLLESNAAQELPADQVHWAAAVAGIEPARLEAVGRFSPHFRWFQHRQGEARYMGAERATLQRFERWFEHRHERAQLPDPQALLLGLKSAYARRDSAVLVGVQACLHLRGESPPEEARHWLAWALGDGQTLPLAPGQETPV